MTDALSASSIREVQNLALAAAAQTIVVEGRTFSPLPAHALSRPEPEPEALVVRTLEALCEFLRAGQDSGYLGTRRHFVHVKSPTEVRLMTGLFGSENQRVTVLLAHAIEPDLKLGQFVDPETFVIRMRTLFEETTDRTAALALVGNLTTEAVRTVSDDGISQTATARRGIVRREEVRVPGVWTLRPFRTFVEVAQPESPFLLRLRGGGDDEPPSVALFEMDGGRWALDAIARIKAHLRAELPSLAVYG